MAIRNWAPGKVVQVPRGSWLSTSQRRMGTPSRGTYIINSRFSPGVVGSRPGLSAVTSASGKVTSIYNWLAPSGANYIAFQDGLEIKALTQGGATAGLFSAPAGTRSTVFSEIDVWLYYAGFNTAGNGTFQVQIFDGTNNDTAFRASPTLTSATPSDSGAGLVTQGLHYFGFVYQNRDGFQTVPVTQVSSAQISFTTNAGLRRVTIVVDFPAQPDGGLSANGGIQATLFLLATTQANPEQWYFVPAAVAPSTTVETQPVPFNAPSTLTFIFDISDDSLAASADPANGPNANPNYFLQLTQDSMGNGPFLPSFVVAYGTRMCYGAGTVLYVSGQSAPQQLTGDQNTVRMPNQRALGMAFPLPASNSLYITGEGYTAYVTDNSDVPGTWAQPVFVSGSIGSPFPGNVCFKTGGNYVWMATERGLDLFNGQFQQKPITFLISGLDATGQPIGWNRVNWNAAYAIQVADDVQNQKCYVAVPLDGATEPNYQFVIDYQNAPDGGISFDNVDISIDQYNPQSFSAIGVVKELATSKTNLWIGPVGGGSILHFDTSILCEVESYWESGLVRSAGEGNSSMIRIGQLDMWMRGSQGAVANVTLYGPDRVLVYPGQLQSTTGVAATLSPSPGLMYLVKTDLSPVENYTVRAGTNAGMAYELSAFRGYTKAALYNR